MSERYELTDAQCAIRDAPQSTRLIIAPPGSGKTEALALRAAGAVEQGWCSYPHRILAVTFSNRARDNLLARLRRTLGRKRTQQYLTVCNLHGFAARIYWSHGRRLGHVLEEMQIPQRWWLEERLKEKGTNRNQGRAVKALLQECKLAPVDDETLLYQLAERSELAFEIEEERQLSRQLDYADLMRYAQIILSEDAVAYPYREHFAHVLVDEFQDLTPQQADIIDSISNNNVTWAGDPGQAIYSFTGADPIRMESRLRGRAEEVHEFQETHRSSPAVVDVLNSIAPILGLSPVVCARPERWPDGGAAYAYTFSSRQQEARCVRYLADQILGDDESASVAIISRGQFRRQEIDREFAENFAGAPRFWSTAVTSTHTARLLTQALHSLGEPDDDADSIVSELLARTRDIVDESEVDCLEELRLCDRWLREAVENGLSVREAVGRVQISDDANVSVGPGVHLLNAHVGKGQEFDHVIVCGLEQDSIPSKFAKTAEEVTEELRVLRVVVSRAKTSCIFTWAQTWEGWYGVNRTPESRWWRLVASACHD